MPKETFYVEVKGVGRLESVQGVLASSDIQGQGAGQPKVQDSADVRFNSPNNITWTGSADLTVAANRRISYSLLVVGDSFSEWSWKLTDANGTVLKDGDERINQGKIIKHAFGSVKVPN